ncbi:MAG TPA: hypothetical protein DEB40_14050 [Elusimicrobia bacterium]|nr:hypothetical protein [Elusimicrobiota bacterium]HBT62854.1 hypothetical protein [Elusimicrobiota bacterium]
MGLLTQALACRRMILYLMNFSPLPEQIQSLLAGLVEFAALCMAALWCILKAKRRRRNRTARVSLLIPSASETRGSVARFREAAARYFNLEFVWDHYDEGRVLWLPVRRRSRPAGPGHFST